MAHPDLDHERAHLDRAHDALRAMARKTERALSDATVAATEADSEVAVYHLRKRLESLAERDDAVAFGRIDHDGERHHVGRRHVEDDVGDPLVVDWRAPVSIPFYRATVRDPLGLDRRRRFLHHGRHLDDILEEDFADPDGALLSGGIPDPLLAELERERTGAMRDIVATIAAEQDEIIRAPLDRLLIVQGGPGTGKTAVALHRAAFLLFEHRLALMDRGVLVVGPNPVFLRYVADVLPSLGETSVRQTTIDGLRPASARLDDAAEGGAADGGAAATLKGDAVMADVVAAAIAASIQIPDEAVALPTEWGQVRLDPDDVQRAVEEIRARHVPHATGKESLRNQLLHRAYEVHERMAEVPALKTNFVAAARRDRGVRAFIDRVWPSLSAPAVLHRLLTSPAARRRATAGLLDDRERDLLARPLPRKIADVRWLGSEIPLLDEIDTQLQGVRTTYGHIIVDEAQDLSAMALRMLARRADRGSMTIVGDLAQATRPWAQASWDAVEDALLGQAPVQRSELTIGYRTPAPILDLANRLLAVAAPDVTPARSIRTGGIPPRFEHVSADQVAATVARAVVDLDATDDGSDGPGGTIAVVAVESAHEELARALDESGTTWARGIAGLGGIALLTPLLAKGLEFDHVVCVEPAAIVDDGVNGHRALFVALTRATTTLWVVHAEGLPDALG